MTDPSYHVRLLKVLISQNWLDSATITPLWPGISHQIQLSCTDHSFTVAQQVRALSAKPGNLYGKMRWTCQNGTQ